MPRRVPRLARSPAVAARAGGSVRFGALIADPTCDLTRLYTLFPAYSISRRITDPERVFDIWWAAFRQQYNAGGYLNVCMHPFQSGRALRIAMLERLITRMKTLPGVWFPTCEQVARYCIDSHPTQTGAL